MGSRGTVDEHKRVFLSTQWTEPFSPIRRAWVGIPEKASMKASLPPHNNPRKLALTSVSRIDAPALGPRIPKTTMEIFSDRGIVKLAEAMNLTIPHNRLHKAVQRRMDKVHEMIEAAREVPSLAGRERKAIEKLEVFVNAFQNLEPEMITDVHAWDKFLESHVGKGWEERLHPERILENFGFSREAALRLRRMEYVWPDGERVPYEQHALRWLSKVFVAYGPPGTVREIVNLIYAMMSPQTTWTAAENHESAVVKMVSDFRDKIESQSFKGLWIPTHYAMDAETDDSMCWLLLEYIHQTIGSELDTLVQLPTDPMLNNLEKELTSMSKENTSMGTCRVFRDPDSMNANPVKKYWSGFTSTRNASGCEQKFSPERGLPRSMSKGPVQPSKPHAEARRLPTLLTPLAPSCGEGADVSAAKIRVTDRSRSVP